VNDTRFFDNPDVVSGLKIGFYAGAPIKSSNGFTLGSVCTIDNSPRKLTPDQLNCLKKVANQVSKLLDLRIKNKQIKENT
ncbi:GAF domain-containing protein, partial [Acinetobacter baumannii]